jgi:hypothetical protein
VIIAEFYLESFLMSPIADSRRTGFAVIVTRLADFSKIALTNPLSQVPYIHFDTYKNVRRQKDEIADIGERPKGQLLRPDGEHTGNVFPKTSIHVIKKDLHGILPLHCRKTLSEFFFHSRLQRPKQVVTCHFEDKWRNEDPLTLMVDQLWMLVLVDGTHLLGSPSLGPDANFSGTIITSFPSQMGGVQREFPYIYTDVVEEILGHLRSQWRPPITTQLELAFMIIKKCIGFLFNQRSRYNKRFRFLNIYEQQLSDIVSCLPKSGLCGKSDTTLQERH